LVILAILIVALAVGSYFLAFKRASAWGQTSKLKSLPRFHGNFMTSWVLLASFMGWLIATFAYIWLRTSPEALSIGLREELAGNQPFYSLVLALIFASIAFLSVWFSTRATTAVRRWLESTQRRVMLVAAMVAVLTTVGIIASLVFEAYHFFQKVPIQDFLFCTQWSPQTAIRSDQVAAEGAFCVAPLLVGTLLISFIALVVAVPLGLYAAIYLSEYASSRVRTWTKPMLEILAGIPTVVYGVFAALIVAPFLRDSGAVWGVSVSSESALAAGLVMGVMIIPFVSSLSDDAIQAVPISLREGSLGLGATQSETIKKVVLPAALPGIVGGVLLAASRAIGETMIVVMAAGLTANMTVNPLEAVTTFTVQIVVLLTGDQEFDSAKTLAAFALGIFLFAVTLVLNYFALKIVREFKEQYE
jgi:phosphate transport system permease protein